jgi:hypothetical protein
VVQLSAYGTAVFLADMAYSDSKIKAGNSRDRSALLLLRSLRGNTSFLPDGKPKLSVEEIRIKRWEREKEKRDFILIFLKEKYPDIDYADLYSQDNHWDKPLMYPTEESTRCEYLHEDGRHCNMKRTETTCYTCCFVCHTPSMCAWTNCPLLPDDRKPSSVI